MYSEIYLRLEPLGLERVAAAVRAAGHDVRLLDLQIFTHETYFGEVSRWEPEAIGFSLNYLANVP
jgi:hopanoid C-3 methylase